MAPVTGTPVPAAGRSPGTGPDEAASRQDRRVRRTRRALTDAFVSLVLERGYDNVAISDIADRADVARATFYTHFESKERLLEHVSAQLVKDYSVPLGLAGTVVVHGIAERYDRASESRDLYRVCLGGGGADKAREAYSGAVAREATKWLTKRVAPGASPRIPVPVVARMIAGAHTAALLAWLNRDWDYTAAEMALMEAQFLNLGLAWVLGISPDDVRFEAGPPPPDGAPSA